MKELLKSIFLLIALGYTFSACGDDDRQVNKEGNKHENTEEGSTQEEEGDKEEESPTPAIFITPIEQLNQTEDPINSHADITKRSSVKMNFRTYTEVGKSGLGEPQPHYPRIKKMANGDYIMFFQKGSSKSSGIGQRCCYALSSDLKNWIPKKEIFNSRTLTDNDGNKIKRYYANCDAVVLKNGDILAVASYRGDNYKVKTEYDGIEMRRSTDNGQTWSEYQEIFKGGVTWEPYIIELSSGEIQCYFTDSNRTGKEGHGQDTGVAMVVSHDGGTTWEPMSTNTPYNPYYVIRMAWEQNGETMFNHQMPCIIQLNNSNELVAAMESHPGGQDYHISLAYSGEDGQWDYLETNQEGPSDSENMQFLGSAPYLIQFPSGETLLSYNRGGYHLKIGDSKGRNFEKVPYDPFKGAFWGALCLLDNHRAIGTIPHASDETIIIAQFVLNHRINAIHRSVSVNGNNEEWKETDHALFVGDKTQAQATLRCAYDEDNLYFLAEILDENLSTSSSDYISIYMSPIDKESRMNDKTFRINIAANGLKSIENYNNGQWKEVKKEIDVKVTKCDRSELSEKEKGYIAEIAIPRTELAIIDGEVLVNYAITRNYAEIDALQKTTEGNIDRWIPISGIK